MLKATFSFVLAGVTLGLGPCSRGGGSSSGSADPAAPSASVVTIANELGGCPDLSACEKECDAGSPDRCRRLGVTYEFGKSSVTKDEKRATTYYEQACAMHDGQACLSAGRMYEFAHGVAKDDAKATQLYDRSCAAGVSAGCYNQGIMLENGRGVAKDESRAGDLYDQVCADGSKTACESAKAVHARLAQADGGRR